MLFLEYFILLGFSVMQWNYPTNMTETQLIPATSAKHLPLVENTLVQMFCLVLFFTELQEVTN